MKPKRRLLIHPTLRYSSISIRPTYFMSVSRDLFGFGSAVYPRTRIDLEKEFSSGSTMVFRFNYSPTFDFIHFSDYEWATEIEWQAPQNSSLPIIIGAGISQFSYNPAPDSFRLTAAQFHLGIRF